MPRGVREMRNTHDKRCYVPTNPLADAPVGYVAFAEKWGIHLILEGKNIGLAKAPSLSITM
jgi:hypothetical protein